MFKIGELSKRTNISVPAIRFYEEKGLLFPVNVDMWTGYRYYDESSVARLNEIAYYKSLGFSLEEICNLDERIIKNKIESSKKNLEKLSKNINILSSFNKNEGGNMKKSEIAREVLNLLEEKHLNLYHSASKAKVHEFVEKQDWDNMSEEDFDVYMRKLFAMFSDTQTTWHIKYLRLDKRFQFIQNEVYTRGEDCKLIKVVKIGGKNSSEIVEMLKTLIPYETSERFTSLCEDALNNGYTLSAAGA